MCEHRDAIFDELARQWKCLRCGVHFSLEGAAAGGAEVWRQFDRAASRPKLCPLIRDACVGARCEFHDGKGCVVRRWHGDR